MIRYIEAYEILGLGFFGIQDREISGYTNFYEKDKKEKKEQRFYCWSNVCIIGAAPDIGAARKIIHDEIIIGILEEESALIKKLNLIKDVIKNLDADKEFSDPYYLARYLKK